MPLLSSVHTGTDRAPSPVILTPATRSGVEEKPVFLNDVHSLRAVAIIFIVAAHCLALFNWNHLHSHAAWLESLMPNGTVFFVFIAGLLFQHLSVRFEFAGYLKRKWRNVILPYLVLSLPIILTQALFTHEGVFSPASSDHSSSFAVNAVWSLMTGVHTQGQFWFIPMISIFYLLAPVFVWLDRSPNLYRLLPLMLLITVLVHRPSNLDHVWQSMAYFTPVYVYGMWFSRNRERAAAWHRRWLPELAMVIAAVTWLEVMILRRPGYISSGMFSMDHGVIDTNAIQKLLLCGVLLVALRHTGEAVAKCLRHVGDLSFGIFFLHMLVINAYAMAGLGKPMSTLPLYTLTVALIMAVCIQILWWARRLFGRYSRSLVGC